MDLILLGTGSPPPDPGTSGHADGIVVDDCLYLLDAGRNVCRQIAAAGFSVQGVDHQFSPISTRTISPVSPIFTSLAGSLALKLLSGFTALVRLRRL